MLCFSFRSCLNLGPELLLPLLFMFFYLLNISFVVVEICTVDGLALYLVFHGLRLKFCSIKFFVAASL
jgi:hypothetical protein